MNKTEQEIDQKINKKLSLWLDLENPIVAAVMPLKEEAQKSARLYASDRVEALKALLEVNDWDLNKIAPYPSGRLSPHECSAVRLKRAEFTAIFLFDHSTKRLGKDALMKYDAGCAGRYIQMVFEAAGQQYDAFVAKLNKKIGVVTHARISGSHVWGYSFLFVTKPDGSTEVWKTQQITNVSKLGKIFNQWPSRKLKHGEAAALW